MAQIVVQGVYKDNITAPYLDSLRKLKSATDNMNNSSSGFMNSFKGNLAANALSKIIDLTTEAITNVVKLGVTAEQTAVSFEVMTGSAMKGRQVLQDLKKWADVTPFTTQDANEAGKMLLNYGVSAKNLIPTMNMLGNASGGVKERFDRMTYAFGQINAAGKMQGQDLRQLIDAGFNPLQQAAKGSTKEYNRLLEEMKKGNLTIDWVIQQFKSATEEGGRFSGMMEKQSQTVSGLWSTLMSEMESASINFFDKYLSPAIKAALKGTQDLINQLKKGSTVEYDKLIKMKGAVQGDYTRIQSTGLSTEAKQMLIDKFNKDYKDVLTTPLDINMSRYASDKVIQGALSQINNLTEITRAANQAEVAKKRVQELKSQLESGFVTERVMTQSVSEENPVGVYENVKRKMTDSERNKIVSDIRVQESIANLNNTIEDNTKATTKLYKDEEKKTDDKKTPSLLGPKTSSLVGERNIKSVTINIENGVKIDTVSMNQNIENVATIEKTFKDMLQRVRYDASLK